MIRVGILGAAGIAPQALITPVRRRSDMVVGAVAARSRASSEAFAAAHGIPRAYEGYDALLADPDIDLVYVALPPSEHARWSTAALNAGKHVLCEKPITMDGAQARLLAEVAERADRRLIEAFHDHYHPLTTAMVDLLRSGELGGIRSIDAWFTAENLFSPTSLRHVPELGGGALMDLGCYPAHWLRRLGGAQPAVVSARSVPNALGADLEIEAHLRFESGPHEGATGRLFASMAEGMPFDASVHVIGERGSVRVQNMVLPHLGHRITTDTDGVSRTWTVAGRETYDHELDAIVAALVAGTPVATERSDFVANMELIDAVYRAAGVTRTANVESSGGHGA